MASSTFFTSKSDWAVLLASHLVSRVHSCYTGFLFFLNSVGLWVFGFLFLPGFLGKSSCSTISFLLLFSLGTFFSFFFRIHLHIGVHLKKSLSCIWEWIGKKVTGLGGIVLIFAIF